MSLTVIRTLDVGYCLKVLTRPEIMATISEDGATEKHLKVDVINDYWVEFLDGDIELGVAQFTPIFKDCYIAHIQVLPEHRKEYTQKIGPALWGWIEDNLKDSLIITHVPVLYQNVKNFLLANDFKEVGTLEKAFLKEGKKQDMWVMQRRVS